MGTETNNSPEKKTFDLLKSKENLLFFLINSVLMFIFNWDLGIFVWGLWFSSLTVGYAMILSGILHIAFSRTDENVKYMGIIGRIVLSLFFLGFFTVHFGGFHFGHGMFLFAFFPLEPGMESVQITIPLFLWHLFKRTWFFVLSSLLASLDKFKKQEGEFNPMEPYKNVVRMHLLIFFFAFTKIIGIDNRLIYIVVMFVYFPPFGFKKKGVEKCEYGDGGPAPL